MSRPPVEARARRIWRQLVLVVTVTLLSTGCGEEPSTPVAPTVPTLVVQCPADIVSVSATGAPIPVQVPPATTSGGVPPATVSCTPSGAPFPLGTTRVTCQATDSRGATASCAFEVRVSPPPLSLTSYLAFGDSMTAGEVTAPVGSVGADGFLNFRPIVVPTESYPAKLQSLMRARYASQSAQLSVTNAGLSREWAIDGANRFPGVVASTNPQAVLLLEGANDIEAMRVQASVTSALAALRQMVRIGRGRGSVVFLATLPPGRPGGRLTLPVPLLQSLNAGIRAGAASEGAILVDLEAAFGADANTLIGVDGLHPTEAGYQRIADAFFAAIRSAFEGR